VVQVSIRNLGLNICHAGVTIYGYNEIYLFCFIFLAKDISFIIQINTIVFVMVLQGMMNSHKIKQKDNIGKIRTGVKASLVIFPILGLTWVFGLMTFNRETLFLRYLFAVFNSAQGLLIFLFHCVFNRQVSM